MQESRQSNATIAIVDDDPSVREGLSSLIRSAGPNTKSKLVSEENSPPRTWATVQKL